jgi:serine/threonine protein kinase
MEPRYEALLPLGRGGLSQVYFGVLHGARGYVRPVVLKVAIGGEDGDEALVREAHVSSRLNHPNLVHVYELFQGDLGLTLAMEYSPGISLHTLVRALAHEGVRMPWAVAARIVADAARGLAHAHRARDDDGRPLGILHRDVSLANLLVTEDGFTKVLDFGIARSALAAVTALDVVKGTVGYMSPEQARGETLTSRTDVFSLGVVLHELLSGRPLFSSADPHAAMQAVVTAPIPPLPTDLPPSLHDIVAHMLVRDPSHRTSTMDALADGLEIAATGWGGSSRDVAMLLASECGSILTQRRDHVRALLAGGRAALPRRRAEHAGTLMLLESAFDIAIPESISAEHPPLDEGVDTFVDHGDETTLDPPEGVLPPRRPR